MVTIVAALIFGLILVGFIVWVTFFGGMKRRGQSGATQIHSDPPKENRAPGLD